VSTGIEPEDLKALLDAFDRSDWQEMTVAIEGDTVHVSRSADGFSLPAPGSAPASAPPAAPVPPTVSAPPPALELAPPAAPAAPTVPAPSAAPLGVPVESPSVGLFWAASAPGAPPFVEVGSRVEADDVVGIVEVMKLMNHVSAGVAGVVTAVAAENGKPVEFGQPLVFVDIAA
jgi:acetyl-CoA carboxylase biotin carboxyl carrier protein